MSEANNAHHVFVEIPADQEHTKNAQQVFVEIPVDQEHQNKLINAINTITAIQNHPYTEISQNPGHLLLLKLYQRDERLFNHRILAKESRLNSIKTEIFQLCCFFFLFHAFFLTILSSTTTNPKHEQFCHKWWIPSVLSVSTSFVLIFLVQVKLCRYWKVNEQLRKEKTDNRALTRCIQELRMKGASFDLGKEPCSGKRMRSSSVEIKWRPISWCCKNLLTVCLVCVTGLLFPASRFILCV